MKRKEKLSVHQCLSVCLSVSFSIHKIIRSNFKLQPTLSLRIWKHGNLLTAFFTAIEQAHMLHVIMVEINKMG